MKIDSIDDLIVPVYIVLVTILPVLLLLVGLELF